MMCCVGNSSWWKKHRLGFIATALALTTTVVAAAAPGLALQEDQDPADSAATQGQGGLTATRPRCRMGGLKASEGIHVPKYQWEMLHAETGEPFMHFIGWPKHTILGLDVGQDCNRWGDDHPNSFMTDPPCKNGPVVPTRESLLQCLPDTSERCSKMMPSRDPAVLRMSVVFKDPRDVVIYEHMMRIDKKEKDIPELIPFIYERFETIVSWQFVRWVWHTTFYKDVSHVMFYEDIKTNPEHLMDLASFMGLNASLEQVQEVQENYQADYFNGTFETYNIPRETIEYANETMIRLLPQEMLARYGLSPTPGN